MQQLLQDQMKREHEERHAPIYAGRNLEDRSEKREIQHLQDENEKREKTCNQAKQATTCAICNEKGTAKQRC